MSDPLKEYRDDQFTLRRIVVGAPIRDPLAIGWTGKVIVGDFTAGQLRLFDPDTGANDTLAPTATFASLVSIDTDQFGQEYLISDSGTIRRIGPRKANIPTEEDPGGGGVLTPTGLVAEAGDGRILVGVDPATDPRVIGFEFEVFNTSTSQWEVRKKI
jgi:hypothetical protein